MSDAKPGVGPHFQLDLLAGDEGGENGPRSHRPRVRVSARARRLSLRVYPDARVEVVVPPRAGPRDVEQFIAAHREWIDAKRAVALRNRPAPQVFPPEVIELRLTGERLALARIDTGPILRALRTGSHPRLRAALRTWLLGAARARLAPRVAALAAAMGVTYSQVCIRRQRSRWGSCSARGTISLNCCLLFQRPEVVDYLIVHELTHMKHMNHSARFWQAVERQCADWRALDAALLQGFRHVPRWVFSDE